MGSRQLDGEVGSWDWFDAMNRVVDIIERSIAIIFCSFCFDLLSAVSSSRQRMYHELPFSGARNELD